MYKNKKFLAIIPARGGSKRLPRKNILPLMDEPLISWTIKASLSSKYIDRIVVSSDDPEILSVAKDYSSNIIERPSDLATDESGTIDVIEHVLSKTEEEYDYLVLLQPTSPLRTALDIDNAIKLLFEKKTDSVISVSEVEHSPLWSNTLAKDGCMIGFVKEEVKGKRSQDLEKYYRLNGAIYIVNIKKFLKYSAILFDNSYAYLMSKEKSIDIDTQYDFICAEAIIKYTQK